MNPSGAQYVIRHGAQEAVAVAVGGGLRTYSVGGRPVLDGYDADAICDGARCQTLVPWPNRVQDGKWRWAGVDQQLAITEPEQHNAIHGLARWLVWDVVGHEASSVTLRCVIAPQPGYPWMLEVTNVWTLADHGLMVSTSIQNRSDTPAPVAIGFHPYLTVGTATVDDAVLTIPATERLVTGAQQIPTGVEAVAGTPYDFRTPTRLGDIRIDHTYAALQRDADGLARLRLESGDGGVSATLWVDAAYPYLEIFTGDALPDPGARRRGLGVEPMSAPPNAMATGESLVTVEPGDFWRGRWGIESS